MNRLARCAPNGTDRKGLGRFLWCAVVAGSDSLLDNLDLTVEPSRTTLDQRNICSNAHLVDMSASIQVVQRIEYHREALEPIDVELRILDIRMMRLELHS